MADMKALFAQRFDAARIALTDGDETTAAESLRAAIVAARNDPNLRRELASALFNLGKLSRKLGPAGQAEAGPLLTEALAISEELLGSRDAALTPVLQELSRLHVQQSQPQRAEQALQHLLAIARVKGDEHPDVAVALSDLAFVKRKLGDEASAEALYRDALRIQEKALEPNHAVTVGTLERLSETCAARGNFAEALLLLRRALPTREAALGAGHERVRAARSRIADLELQMAIAANKAAAAAARATRDAMPKVAASVAAAPLVTPPILAPAASQIVVAQPESVRSFGSLIGESPAAPRDVVVAGDVQDVHVDVASGDVVVSDAALDDWRSTIAPLHADAPEPVRKKRTALFASAGVAAVVMAVSGVLMLRPRAASGKDPVTTSMSTAQHTAPAGAFVEPAPTTRTASVGTSAVTMVAATQADSPRAVSVTPASTPAVIQREQRAPESARPELRAPRVDLHLDSVNIPSIPATPTGDAILRSAIDRQRASDTDRAGTRDEVSRPASPDVESAHTSPKMVGRPPEPAFPDALLRLGKREGRVLVRFMVNEVGRVDLATVVVEQSDDELFTAAVRDVLPYFRFEPAHMLAPGSRPLAAWVSVPFRFTTKKK